MPTKKSIPCLLTTVLRPNLSTTHRLQSLLRCTLALPGVARRSSSAARRRAWDLHSPLSSQNRTTLRHSSRQQSPDLTQLCTLAAILRVRLKDGRQSTDQAEKRIWDLVRGQPPMFRNVSHLSLLFTMLLFSFIQLFRPEVTCNAWVIELMFVFRVYRE